MNDLVPHSTTPPRRRWRGALIAVLVGLFLVSGTSGCATSGGGYPGLAVSLGAPPMAQQARDASAELGAATAAAIHDCCDCCCLCAATWIAPAEKGADVLLAALLLALAGLLVFLERYGPVSAIRGRPRRRRYQLKAGLLTTLCVCRS